MELHFERGKIRAVLPNTTSVIVRTETDTYEYPGAFVCPGFVDNHAHVLGFGTKLAVPSLRDCSSAKACVDVLQTAIVPETGWLHAMGWNQELWDDHSMPTLTILDNAFPDTPVSASRVDGHALWINTAAAKLAGVDPTNGLLIDTDMEALWTAMPPVDVAEKERRIIEALSQCASVGITEVHDMDVHPADVEIMRGLAEAGKLPTRIQSFVSSQHDEWLAEGLLPAGGELQRTVGIKLYADGALGSRGAALLSPYSDAPDTTGTLFLTKERIEAAARSAIDAGWWAVAIHAIGDAAVRQVLDAYQTVRSWKDGKDIVLRIEHAQHVHPDDQPRFAELNVFACIQPEHCTSDASMAEVRLGTERLQWAYPWRSLAKLGCQIGAGSDFPIEPPSPLKGIHAFANRISQGSGQVWQGQERITVDEAFRYFTQGAHESVDLGYRRGSIELGFDADVTILDRDIHSCPAEEIESIKVLATFVAGKLRYSA